MKSIFNLNVPPRRYEVNVAPERLPRKGCPGKGTFSRTLCALPAAAPPVLAEDVTESARKQILSLEQQKAARTPAQRKMDSQLIYAREPGVFRFAAPDMKADVELVDGRVLVDIAIQTSPEAPAARRSRVPARLEGRIADLGGTLVSSFPVTRRCARGCRSRKWRALPQIPTWSSSSAPRR
jgi:hypothetical protein